MLRVRINNQECEFSAGTTILQALYDAGIEVPALCHDERLKPAGDCRMCLVRIDGWPHLVTACNTPLAEGMAIATHTAELEAERRALLTMLTDRYPPAPVDLFPEKPLHGLLKAYGLAEECSGVPDPALLDDSHPYIRVDMTRCIDCLRCVRICNEVQGQFVWEVLNRGAATHIVPDSGTTLLASSCVSCGACVDTCPTGALEDRSIIEMGAPAEWTRTTCPYCGTGCEMNVGTRAGRIVQIKPASDAPVNKGHLCVKGRYSYEFIYAHDRATTPMIREGGKWRCVSWDEVVAFSAERLRQIVAQYGADSVGVLGSARATNEENYLTQKFARVALGTNNVDCCARVCHAPTAAAMKLTFGTGAATNSFDDIEQARAILVCGSNATENHPIIGARIKQAALRGVKLIVIDPRRIELAEYADAHLALRPGTNVPLLNAMAHTIIEEGLCDDGFLTERVAGIDEFQDFIAASAPEKVADLCGVPAQEIRRAARLYATTRPALCVHGLGMTEHVQGTEGVMCLLNLALLTGNIGKPGAGINPLRGQITCRVSAHMGCEPDNLTGSIPLADGRELLERVWRAPVPANRGLNLMQMMDAAAAGGFKALWAIGYDIFLTNANANATRRALAALELIIVQDMFLNETAREFGTVFLPVASSFEKDGTFMNAERRVQRVRKAIEPPGAAKSDWEIICLLARALGRAEFFDFHSPEEIWDEVRAVWNAGRGISYARLEQAGLQWPCPAEDHPGTQILHKEEFAIGKQAALRCIPFNPTLETITDEFPLLLITGRVLHQFNAGTMTMRTRNTVLRPTDYLNVSSDDARALGVADGAKVRLQSRYGSAVLPIKVSGEVKPGEVFATFHTADSFLNCVTSAYRDGYVGAPEYKVTAVRIEVVS